MTHDDIKRLEGAFKVTLPQRYTELLLRYPTALEENGFYFGDGFEPSADSLDHCIERILHQADDFNFWHSPHSPLLNASGAGRRRLMSDYVAKRRPIFSIHRTMVRRAHLGPSGADVRRRWTQPWVTSHQAAS